MERTVIRVRERHLKPFFKSTRNLKYKIYKIYKVCTDLFEKLDAACNTPKYPPNYYFFKVLPRDE